MISLSVTDFSRKLKTMLDLVEFRGEEIILIRNKHKIVIIPHASEHLSLLLRCAYAWLLQHFVKM